MVAPPSLGADVSPRPPSARARRGLLCTGWFCVSVDGCLGKERRGGVIDFATQQGAAGDVGPAAKEEAAGDADPAAKEETAGDVGPATKKEAAGDVGPATRETAGDVGPAAKEEAAGDAVDLATKKGARFCMKRAP